MRLTMRHLKHRTELKEKWRNCDQTDKRQVQEKATAELKRRTVRGTVGIWLICRRILPGNVKENYATGEKFKIPYHFMLPVQRTGKNQGMHTLSCPCLTLPHESRLRQSHQTI